MTKLLKPDELEPGMVLDKDVANLQGAVLLRKGSPITERHITIFKTWGVSTVFIHEDEAAPAAGGKSPNDVAQLKLKELEIEMNDKFSQWADNEIMMQIKDMALKQRTASIMRKFNS